MQPLAYKVRPKKLEDVVGQSHLTGVNGVITKMLESNKLFSMILYGPPGLGKTTIAKIIASNFTFNIFEFNASVDQKEKLKEVFEASKFHEYCILIVDEIHRMKKDIQDFLLPSLENGSIILIGLTTENPYHSVNKAIRSRAHTYKLNDISLEDIIKLLKKIHNEHLNNVTIPDDVFEYLANSSNIEIRTAINMLELISTYENIDLELAQKVIGKKALALDKNSDSYYDTLSAFQKSIRGSDVNASLHYLARLLVRGDLEIIFRRLAIIAYEDIGLGNSSIGPKCMAAIEAVRLVGLPEGRIPLATLVVEMALSPKSNSAYLALDEAINDYENGLGGAIPKHILNREIKEGAVYKYPHDYPEAYVSQQYLPDNLVNKEYYKPKNTGSLERAFAEKIESLKKINCK